jgi:hypothetical protein
MSTLGSRPGPIVTAVLALSLQAARNGAIIAVVVFVALAIASAWLMKSLAQKVAVMLVLGLLAVLVWSQRASLDDCADRVRDSRAAGAGALLDTTCTFLGQDITIKTG